MAILEALPQAPQDGARRRYRAYSPATRAPIGEFEAASESEVRAAVARARVAQAAWAKLNFRARAAHLWRLVDEIVRRQDDIVARVIAETGKPKNEAIAMEVMAPCIQISHYAKHAARYLKTQRRAASGLLRFSKKVTLFYQPLGVVGLITPWNGPLALTANPLAQALMAGNAVVHKPSEVTPFSALLLQELAHAAGLPEHLYQVLQGDGETGAALVNAGVNKISFTGSVATGRKVGEACGRQLIPVTLELGGKDAMIVCRDADLERAAEGAVRGACWNSGHYCCSTERIYVPEEIYEPFVEKVLTRARALTQSSAGECDVGAVFWDKQLDIIEAHLADARARGARVLLGGERNREERGCYFPPTVVVDVNHEMDLMRRETFGPIVAIQKVRDEEHALACANDSEYGLGGNIWTRDEARGVALAERVETGSVCVNDIAVTYGVAEAPFGGVKSSGVGQVNGEAGIRGYCHAHPVIVNTEKKPRGGYPYTEESAAGLQKAVRFLFGNKWLRKWVV